MISCGIPKAKAFSWDISDSKALKRGHKKGLDTLVFHTLNYAD